MKQERALAALRKLAREANDLRWTSDQALANWRMRVRVALSAALGSGSDLVAHLDQIDFGNAHPGESAMAGMNRMMVRRSQGLRDAVALIDSARLHIEIVGNDEAEPIEGSNFDPELWAHVRGLVESKDWGKIASTTVTFVEDRIRTWAGDPRDAKKSGARLFGKALFLAGLGSGKPLELGSEAGEHEGWQYLGMGFAQALGNVDRHRIQKRSDAQLYAIGVLGLGSLLLTQLRNQHPAETSATADQHEANEAANAAQEDLRPS